MFKSLLFTVLLAGCASHAGPAIKLYEAGDFAGAAREAQAGLTAHPHDDSLWGMRVRAALALGDGPGVTSAYAAYVAVNDGKDDAALVTDLATATLRQALASPSAKLKLVAIRAVAKVEIQALADAVGERMGDDDDRVAATAAIAVLHGYPQAPGVAADMLKSEDPEARRIAVEGIADKVGPAAVVDIREAATDPDPSVRATAIRWLGVFKDQASSAVIIRNLKHPDDGVRAAAVTAMAAIGKATKASAVDLQRLADSALADPALAVRLAGVRVLAQLKAEPVLTALTTDPSPLVAVEAAIALGRKDLAAAALNRAGSAESPSIRAGAANTALRALAQPDAVAFVTMLAADPEATVRLAAARALAAAGQREAAAPIFAAAAATDPGAAADLARLGDPRGVAALAALISAPDSPSDLRALAAAAHLIARRITPALVGALADSSGVVRVEAAAALAQLADRD